MRLLDYTSFLREHMILEKEITKKQRPFFDAYAKLFPNNPAPKNTKSREIIRARFGVDGSKDVESNINSLFSQVGLHVDSILSHLPGSIRDGDKLGSSDYYTYEVKVGDEIYWVTNASQLSKEGLKVEIGKKMLTPASLGLSQTYKNSQQLSFAAKESINALSWMSNQTKELISKLIDAAANVSYKFETMKEFFENSTDTTIVKFESIDINLDTKSLQNLINDFGEVLDGIYVLSSVKNIKLGLVFPDDANKPLLDIECDGYMISSKDIKGGGSPSADAIINSLKKGDIPLSEKEKDLAAILLPSSGKSVYDQYMMIASSLFDRKYLKDSAYEYLLNKMNIRSYPNANDLEKYLNNLDEKEYDELITEIYKRSGRGIAADNKNAKRLGSVFVNITKECGDSLNNNFQEVFSSITTKVVSLKQIYMTIELSKDSLKFISKSSDKMEAKFDSSKSTPNNPFNAKLSFKFLKGRK